MNLSRSFEAMSYKSQGRLKFLDIMVFAKKQFQTEFQSSLILQQLRYKYQAHANGGKYLQILFLNLIILNFIVKRCLNYPHTMSLIEVEKLTREVRKLEQQVKQLNRKINSLESQCTVHKELSKKQNKEKQFLNQQIKQLRRRQEEKKYERQEMQNRYANVLLKLENELEERKSKYQKLQNKIQPLVDHDTVRLKILNEVESVHFMQLEEEKRKNNQLKDQILRLKRQNQVLKHQMQNSKMDHENEIRRIKNYIQNSGKNDHLNQLSYEMCLQIQNKLRANYEQARKQSDYYKDKYFSCQRRYQQKLNSLEKQLMLARQQVYTA